MKIIRFIRRFPPSVPGFNEDALIFDENMIVLYKTQFGRTTPNPIKPSTGEAWDKWYGCVTPGRYPAVCMEHEKFKKCLLINGGAPIPAVLPNVNHGYRSEVSEVFVHSGENDKWPGSAGCLTIRKTNFPEFISHFEINDPVIIEII